MTPEQEIRIRQLTRETSSDFLQYMVNRMDVSFFKYGPTRSNYKGEYSEAFLKDVTDTIGSLLHRWEHRVSVSTSSSGNAIIFILRRLLCYLTQYKGSRGNTEYLVDAANGLMIEFKHPQVKGAYFKSTDSDNTPGFSGVSDGERV